MIEIEDASVGCCILAARDDIGEYLFVQDPGYHSQTSGNLFPLLCGKWEKSLRGQVCGEIVLYYTYMECSGQIKISESEAHDLLVKKAQTLGANRIVYRQRWQEAEINSHSNGLFCKGTYLMAMVCLFRNTPP